MASRIVEADRVLESRRLAQNADQARRSGAKRTFSSPQVSVSCRARDKQLCSLARQQVVGHFSSSFQLCPSEQRNEREANSKEQSSNLENISIALINLIDSKMRTTCCRRRMKTGHQVFLSLESLPRKLRQFASRCKRFVATLAYFYF